MDFFHVALTVFCIVLLIYVLSIRSDYYIYKHDNKSLSIKIDNMSKEMYGLLDDISLAKKEMSVNLDNYFKAQSEISKLNKDLQDKNDEMRSLTFMIPAMVNEQYEKFKNQELESVKTIMVDNARGMAKLELEKWKEQYEM